jgi:glycosyltransferase involved in cell wall biosynthesis
VGSSEKTVRAAVLLPCYNEQATVAKVVRSFRAALPSADVYVFDNNSTDATAELAAQAGAIVVHSGRQGKGNVVRHMFDAVEADVFVMADGDDTYPSDAVETLIAELQKQRADMVVGMRLEQFQKGAFRPFHRSGNHLIAGLIRALFGVRVRDVLSGYRVFSREFVKTVPLTSSGFEVEIELTLQAVAKDFVIREVPIRYGERPEGSISKLSTFRDGWNVLRAIGLILKDYKPLLFFSGVCGLFSVFSVAVGLAPIRDFCKTGMVPHFPSAILAAALAVMALISLGVGVILETVKTYHNENFILWRRFLKGRFPLYDQANGSSWPERQENGAAPRHQEQRVGDESLTRHGRSQAGSRSRALEQG